MDTIPNTSKVNVVIYRPGFSCICSIGKEAFHGTMIVRYEPGDRLLEFVSFETWLSSVSIQQMTIEDLCRLAFDELTTALGDIPLCVTIHARTTVHAPVTATIERSSQ